MHYCPRVRASTSSTHFIQLALSLQGFTTSFSRAKRTLLRQEEAGRAHTQGWTGLLKQEESSNTRAVKRCGIDSFSMTTRFHLGTTYGLIQHLQQTSRMLFKHRQKSLSAAS